MTAKIAGANSFRSAVTLHATCVACGGSMTAGVQPWHTVCATCGYEAGALEPTINEAESHTAINEVDREIGLKAVRVENFKDIIRLIDDCSPPGRSLLDVGCAHGWFLEQAAGKFDALGIEPDTAVGSLTAARGLPVRRGYFPQALHAGEQFDVIVFNDVMEHIPDIHGAMRACHERLRAGGLLVLNLPNTRGLFYRISKLFARIGWLAPFERMWQKGFPSPHVHFFDADNLSELAARHDFSKAKKVELASIRAKGLLERMRYSTKSSAANTYLQYFGALAFVPLTRIFPSDVLVCVFRKS